ncbi:hypothetical protein K8T06_16950, partial [bacterium]|nr:hypothetical protein [bacterium]
MKKAKRFSDDFTTIVLLSLLIFFVLESGDPAAAQVVLKPLTTGTVEKEMNHSRYMRFTHFPNSSSWWTTLTSTYRTTYRAFTPLVRAKDTTLTYWTSCKQYTGTAVNRNNIHQGIIEFDVVNTVNGAPFPLPEMTTYNWTAKLVEINCTYGENRLAELYNLRDIHENGIVDVSDYDGYDSMVAQGYYFDDIDITEILRHDLFGAGYGNTTSGFLLRRPGSEKRFDYDSPRIEISGDFFPTPTLPPTNTPPPLPTSTPTATPIYTPTMTPTATPAATATSIPASEPAVRLILSQA